MDLEGSGSGLTELLTQNFRGRTEDYQTELECIRCADRQSNPAPTDTSQKPEHIQILATFSSSSQ